MSRARGYAASTAWLALAVVLIVSAVVLVGLFAYYLIGNLWGPVGVVIALAVVIAVALRGRGRS